MVFYLPPCKSPLGKLNLVTKSAWLGSRWIEFKVDYWSEARRCYSNYTAHIVYVKLSQDQNQTTLHFSNSALGVPLTENNNKVNDKRMLFFVLLKFNQHWRHHMCNCNLRFPAIKETLKKNWRVSSKGLYIDYAIEISFWTHVPPSDWQGTDWGCHKSWRLVSWEPQGRRFLAVRSLIQWEYSHSRVNVQSCSPLRSPFQAAQGFHITLIQNVPIPVKSPKVNFFYWNRNRKKPSAMTSL